MARSNGIRRVLQVAGAPAAGFPARASRYGVIATKGALLCLLALLSATPAFETGAHAQVPTVVVEQVVAASAGGLLSANLDPGRRYHLQVLSIPEGVGFHGTYSQNWFARDGVARAGTGDAPFRARAPWEQELPPPAPSLIQWTFAVDVWNEGGGTLVVRLIDHGPR